MTVRQWWVYSVRPLYYRVRERALMFVAWRLLPRSLVYWAFVRMATAVTPGNAEAPSVTVIDVLRLANGWIR